MTFRSSPVTLRTPSIDKVLESQVHFSEAKLANMEILNQEINTVVQELWKHRFTSLNLENNQIRFEGAKYLVENLPRTVTNLSLKGNQIGKKVFVIKRGLRDPSDQQKQELIKALFTSRHLTILNLHKTQISECIKKCPALPSLSRLIELDLGNNQIGDEGVLALVRAFPSFPDLVKLNLEGNNIGNGGAEALAAIPSLFWQLIHLNLENNEIGDEGAQAIAKSIAAFPETISKTLLRDVLQASGKALAQDVPETNASDYIKCFAESFPTSNESDLKKLLGSISEEIEDSRRIFNQNSSQALKEIITTNLDYNHLSVAIFADFQKALRESQSKVHDSYSFGTNLAQAIPNMLARAIVTNLPEVSPKGLAKAIAAAFLAALPHDKGFYEGSAAYIIAQIFASAIEKHLPRAIFNNLMLSHLPAPRRIFLAHFSASDLSHRLASALPEAFAEAIPKIVDNCDLKKVLAQIIAGPGLTNFISEIVAGYDLSKAIAQAITKTSSNVIAGCYLAKALLNDLPKDLVKAIPDDSLVDDFLISIASDITDRLSSIFPQFTTNIIPGRDIAGRITGFINPKWEKDPIGIISNAVAYTPAQVMTKGKVITKFINGRNLAKTIADGLVKGLDNHLLENDLGAIPKNIAEAIAESLANGLANAIASSLRDTICNNTTDNDFKEIQAIVGSGLGKIVDNAIAEAIANNLNGVISKAGVRAINDVITSNLTELTEFIKRRNLFTINADAAENTPPAEVVGKSNRISGRDLAEAIAKDLVEGLDSPLSVIPKTIAEAIASSLANAIASSLPDTIHDNINNDDFEEIKAIASSGLGKIVDNAIVKDIANNLTRFICQVNVRAINDVITNNLTDVVDKVIENVPSKFEVFAYFAFKVLAGPIEKAVASALEKALVSVLPSSRLTCLNLRRNNISPTVCEAFRDLGPRVPQLTVKCDGD